MGSITLGQSLLVGLWYALANFRMFGFGVCGYCFTKPIVGGTVVGLILGQPVEGMIIGAQINVLYIGYISAGGSQAADPSFAGTLGTALALAAGLDASAAIALAVPLGLIGNIKLMIRMVINSPITHLSARNAVKGNYKMLFLSNVILPQLIEAFIGFMIVFLGCIYGTEVVAAAVANAPAWVLNGLNTIGGMLPTIGICLNLKNIGKANTLPFFFVGFLMYTYLGFSNVVIAVVGFIVAYIAVYGIQPRVKGGNA